MRKKWSFINPEGVLVRTKNLAKFCRDQGLVYDSMHRLGKGTMTECHGWISTHPRAKKKRARKVRQLINIHTFERVSIRYYLKFARQHDLRLEPLSRLLNGRCVSYKDWMLDDTNNLINDHR